MDNYIDTLIAKCLAGETNKKEENELVEWLNLSDENNKYFQQTKIIWQSHKNISISEESALRKIKNQIKSKSGFRKIWIYWQRIAAVLIIPLMIVGIQSFFTKKISPKQNITSTFQEVFTPFGAYTSLTLPDSSNVWLNSGSRIKFPQQFKDDKRIVFLEGEAYFEVKSDELRPFIVTTHRFNVKATGTKFNIRAYSDDKSPQVALVEGKVAVTEKTKNNPERISLKPNEILNFNGENSNISFANEDIYKCYAWKDGKLVFRNDPFEEVAHRMNIQYNADIELRGEKLKQYRFRATFRNESLEQVLNLLKLSSPFVFRQQSPKLLPDGTYSRKKIIISSM
jgi:ferric-dicitrate binding protein FerR (iron transport regulator)